MRVSEAIGGAGKQGSKEAAVEAQRHTGRRHPVWVAAAMLTASIVIIVFILAGLVYFANFPSLCGTVDTLDIAEEELVVPAAAAERRVVAHSAWSLRPQQRTLPLVHPVPYVVLEHTAGPPCAGLHHCTNLLRNIQEFHWQMYGHPEIPYNFMIDSDGNIYEGRGWNSTNTNRGMVLRCNVDVALLGNYVQQNVTEEMWSALRWLLDEGVSCGVLAPDYRLLAHNQVINTLSPGRWALQEIADWPHRCLEHCDRGAVCVRPEDSEVSSSS